MNIFHFQCGIFVAIAIVCFAATAELWLMFIPGFLSFFAAAWVGTIAEEKINRRHEP